MNTDKSNQNNYLTKYIKKKNRKKNLYSVGCATLLQKWDHASVLGVSEHTGQFLFLRFDPSLSLGRFPASCNKRKDHQWPVANQSYISQVI